MKINDKELEFHTLERFPVDTTFKDVTTTKDRLYLSKKSLLLQAFLSKRRRKSSFQTD